MRTTRTESSDQGQDAEVVALNSGDVVITPARIWTSQSFRLSSSSSHQPTTHPPEVLVPSAGTPIPSENRVLSDEEAFQLFLAMD